MKKRYILKTEADTKALAEEVAGELAGSDVIGLIGDLGAGKTTFTQYLAAALGVKKTVTSPTFTIMQVYDASHNGIKRFVHIDAYRLASPEDLAALGVEEWFEDPETVTVIEWAERVERLLPTGTRLLYFMQADEQRIVEVKKIM